jgi:hypothetical protein
MRKGFFNLNSKKGCFPLGVISLKDKRSSNCCLISSFFKAHLAFQHGLVFAFGDTLNLVLTHISKTYPQSLFLVGSNIFLFIMFSPYLEYYF